MTSLPSPASSTVSSGKNCAYRTAKARNGKGERQGEDSAGHHPAILFRCKKSRSSRRQTICQERRQIILGGLLLLLLFIRCSEGSGPLILLRYVAGVPSADKTGNDDAVHSLLLRAPKPPSSTIPFPEPMEFIGGGGENPTDGFVPFLSIGEREKLRNENTQFSTNDVGSPVPSSQGCCSCYCSFRTNYNTILHSKYTYRYRRLHLDLSNLVSN